jgi:hypothetical protein
MILSKFSDFYIKFEKFISPVGLIGGFIFTSLTLTRVDMFLENFWIIVHLCMVATAISVLTYYENLAQRKNIPEADQHKWHFYLTLIIQFLFGGLFSTFFVFYLRSSSVTASWIFLLVLVVLLVGNELWKKHYKRLAFQVSILFISIYLFLIYLLPVIFHRLGADLFIASGLLSLLFTLLFVSLLKNFALEKFKNSHHVLRTSIFFIYVFMNVLYFTNVIPPIPLALKEAGAYHSVEKILDPLSPQFGNYEVQAEPRSWLDYFNRYPVFHRQVGETIYVFSAIFSPVKFNTVIIHQWQYYDEVQGVWVDSNRTTLPIVGGRDGGFRTYSVRQNLPAGLWRVEVMTTQGQVIGTINFRVEDAVTSPNLVVQTL